MSFEGLCSSVVLSSSKSRTFAMKVSAACMSGNNYSFERTGRSSVLLGRFGYIEVPFARAVGIAMPNSICFFRPLPIRRVISSKASSTLCLCVCHFPIPPLLLETLVCSLAAPHMQLSSLNIAPLSSLPRMCFESVISSAFGRLYPPPYSKV